jgi:hypothetical protein
MHKFQRHQALKFGARGAVGSIMTDMSPEARKTIQDLMLIPQRAKIQQKLSLKKKRETTSDVLLKMQGIKHGEKCNRCELNCEIKHQESMTFWASVDGLTPIYNMENCPKQGKLEKKNLKMKKRAR